MTHTSVLYRLQTVDSETDARRVRLDEINALLGENEEVRIARGHLDAAEEHLREAQAQTSDLELEIAGLDSKAKTTSERLYSGVVKNPKELQDMEHELEALARRREVLEEALLAAMVALEEAQAAQASARSEVEAVEARWSASQGDLAGEKHDLQARLAELAGEREGVLAQADPAALESYERLRARLKGVAVSKLTDGVCASCGVAPTSSVAQKARHGELDARCPTCGRILYGG